MNILVVGGGSIGKRHIGNLRTVGVQKVGVIEPRADRREEIRGRFPGTETFETFEKALSESFNGAVIASPTSLHIPQAIELARRGVHLMIEKPLGHNLEGSQTLIDETEKRRLAVLIAYPFRFDGSFLKLKALYDAGTLGKAIYVRGEFSEYLPDWHPWEDYRTFYMAKKHLGGGSLLDQSHILNLAEALCGEVDKVAAINGRFSPLEVETDDLGELLVRFRSGVVGTIHMDMFGRNHVKQLELKCEKGDLIWDFCRYEVRAYYAEQKRWEIFPFKNDKNEMYLNETKHFLACIEGKERPRISLGEGIATMQVLEAAKASAQEERTIAIGQVPVA
jgi:predicted dehydrogenase